jgi:hypothetical protein
MDIQATSVCKVWIVDENKVAFPFIIQRKYHEKDRLAFEQ